MVDVLVCDERVVSIVEQFIQLDQVDSTTLHTALRAGNETATRLRGGEGEREGHRRGLLSGHCEIPRSPVAMPVYCTAHGPAGAAQ